MRIDPATFKLSTVAPAPNEALREAIYDGQVYLLAPTTATQRLVCRVQDRGYWFYPIHDTLSTFIPR